MKTVLLLSFILIALISCETVRPVKVNADFHPMEILKTERIPAASGGALKGKSLRDLLYCLPFLDMDRKELDQIFEMLIRDPQWGTARISEKEFRLIGDGGLSPLGVKIANRNKSELRIILKVAGFREASRVREFFCYEFLLEQDAWVRQRYWAEPYNLEWATAEIK